MVSENITIVICCAGMGTRLGIGSSKALLDIDGEPLIVRLLALLSDCDDIRIVVGFQAERVIEVVTRYRKDVMFVFNYDYAKTGIVDSLQRALIHPREYVVEIDGDIIIDRKTFLDFLKFPGECVAVTERYSENPVLANVADGKIISFSTVDGNVEWTGLAKIKSSKLEDKKEYVYELIEPWLPMPVIEVEARDIDTPADYDKAIAWYENNRLTET